MARACGVSTHMRNPGMARACAYVVLLSCVCSCLADTPAAGSSLEDLDAQWDGELEDIVVAEAGSRSTPKPAVDKGAAKKKSKSKGKKKRSTSPSRKVSFRVCRSHRVVADEYKDRILKVYPSSVDVSVTTTKPPHPYPFAAQMVEVVQWFLLVGLLGGKQLFELVGLPIPDFWPRNMATMGPTAIFVFMIFKEVNSQLLQSNAFDVTFEDGVVWSKAATAHTPTWPEMIAALEKAGLPHVKGSDDVAQFVAGWNTKE